MIKNDNLLALHRMKLFGTKTGSLIHKTVVLLCLYSICRVLFYAFNASYFAGIGAGGVLACLFYGIRFDLSSIILLNAVFIILYSLPFPFREYGWYKTILKWFFIITNSIALLANCADLVYFQFTLKRTTADVFHFFGGGIGNDLGRLLPLFIREYWYVFLIWGALTWLLWFFYKKSEKESALEWNRKTYLKQAGSFIAMGAFAVLLYRGGFQLKPISIVTAGENVEPKNVPIVLNTTFSILRTFDVEGITPTIYFADEKELKAIYDPYHPGKTAPFKRLNVFIIALESFSKEYVGAINGRTTGYTPFLDSLIRQSHTCVNAFANGKRSIEGIPSIVAGIPTWSNEPYISSRYGTNVVSSIAGLLKKKGYSTSFFHGGENGTMGFDGFTKLAGYDKYYGLTEYGNDKDYDGNWGIWDEEYLQYTANMVNKQQQPFCSTVFTLTSHHPFPVPDKYKGKFKEGPLPIEHSIGYTDYALRRFFETAKKMPWFNNTLFVLSADHTGPSNDPLYTSALGSYSIPIIYYFPGADSSFVGMDSTVTQQIDILPSVMDYLNYPDPYFAFGKSVFEPSGDHFGFCFNNNTFQLIDKYYTFEYNGDKAVDLYLYKTDTLLKENILDKYPEIEKIKVKKAQAIIQSYQQSLVNNKMH